MTHEQMAVILYNYAKFTDCDLTVRAGLLEQFPDGDKVSGYAKYRRSLCYEDAGWAGPMRWEQYNGAAGIAEKTEYYLTDMH